MVEKLTYEEFVKKAIASLRKPPYKGIHSVYSGFNEAFRKYFSGEDPVKAVNDLAKQGKIVLRPVKGGVMLYLKEEVADVSSIADSALKKMGLE